MSSSISTSPLTDISSLLQRQQGYAQKSNVGLQDRGTQAERISFAEQVEQRVVQNHGFDAKQNTKEALTNNNKIINTRADQRGTIVNITA